MENLFKRNGLMFWSEEEIKTREMVKEFFVRQLYSSLKEQNAGFNIVQVEAPLLTPREFVNKNYTNEDMWVIGDTVLRPETTMGSYLYAKELLSGHNNVKYRAPIIVWQHGKSFRMEQDQPTKHMRLKEFYQLEFQIIFAPNTANDYSVKLYPDVLAMISKMLGDCRLEKSDRLPDYSEETIDVVCNKTDMEVCSMSKRKDFEGYKVIEVAIGTDRCVYNFLNINEQNQE
jgi:glycyl-tRNA synthetase